jgi:hypothetical protein
VIELVEVLKILVSSLFELRGWPTTTLSFYFGGDFKVSSPKSPSISSSSTDDFI